MGGDGSGSLAKKDKGSIKTYLRGYKIEAKLFFQPVDDPDPGYHSPFAGKSRISGPKTELEINWNVNAKIRKLMTNFFLEIFMVSIFNI